MMRDGEWRTRCRIYCAGEFENNMTMTKDFPGGSVVKNLPANAGNTVRSLGQKDHLEKEMATHSSILAWEIPWTEKPGGLESMGSQKVRHDLTNEQ